MSNPELSSSSTASTSSKRTFGLQRTPAEQQTLRMVSSLLVFVIRRLLFAIVVLLFIIFLSYLGIKMASGMPFGQAASEGLVSTGRYITRLLQGDLGVTTTGGETLLPRSIPEVVRERLPRSLGLLGLSLAFASIVGVGLGILSSRGRSERSLGILIATLVGVSVPSFFAAFLLQWVIINLTRNLGEPLLPVGGFGWDRHIILPMIVLAARPIAQITRVTFITIRETLTQDFVRTAYGKGLARFRVMSGHVMRNAAIPILTTIGISLRFSLSSLPVVELYFGWPGAGLSLLKSISYQDDSLTVALALCLGILFILVNLILDLSYRLIDPRLLQEVESIQTAHKQSIPETFQQFTAEIGDWIKNSPLSRLKKKPKDDVGDDFAIHTMIVEEGIKPDETEVLPPPDQRGSVRAILRNFPLIVGSLLVLALLIVILFGPFLAPNSPFQTSGLENINGQLVAPPYAPSERFPWGTDALGRGIMSLILSGAQQTLVLGLLVVLARTVVGIILGAMAGWTNGSLIDRAILSLSEIISAFPTLLIAMILILALGIREGLRPFIIALCFVGWGEIMQFVRSELIAIRPKPFIESAVAIGVRSPRIVIHHILPNLFSTLISLTALEMGAVLMLLGELGFLGIFIGGGSLIHLPSMIMLYSDVPEWGALLANIRLMARSYPWTALYPMMAFFLAILGFNLFGEGIRRLIAEGNLIVTRIFNRYTFTVLVLCGLGFNWLRSHSGALAFYRQHAAEFQVENVMQDIRYLTQDELSGRALGTPGMDQAATYIAEQFEALGLQDAGEKNTYFLTREHAFGQLGDTPTLSIDDDGPDPEYGLDFAAYPGWRMTGGSGSGPLLFISLGRPNPAVISGWRTPYPDLDKADFSDSVLLALTDREATLLSGRRKAGMLVVTDDPEKLNKRYTISGRSGKWLDLETGTFYGEETPYLWITEETAERLLAGSGYTLADLRDQSAQLGIEELYQLSLPNSVSLSVQDSSIKETTVRHVMGYIPGTSGFDFCTECLGVNLIVVMAQYDSPPLGIDGEIYPAANDNASGVAMMLEMIRVLQESEYQPYKSFLFIAYSGEGLDGGEETSDPDLRKFLQAKTGFMQFEVEAIVHLRGIGGGSGNRLEIAAGGSLRLAELFEQAARQLGTRVTRAEEPIDISRIYEEVIPIEEGGQEAPIVRLYWEGWDEYSRRAFDTLEIISEETIEEAGQSIALALMVLGRETEY